MAYSPTTWTEGITKLGPTNMNKLEAGVQATAVVADAAIPKPGGPATNAGLVWNGSSWVAAKLVDANVDPAAAIAYSKLSLAGSIVNNDIAAAAGIAGSKIGATYAAYTPTWTSSGTAPAIGNAVVVAQFVQVGKIVHAYGRITFGTTSTYGTGFYSFALPATASANALAARSAGSGFGYDSSANNVALPHVFVSTTGTMTVSIPATYLGTDGAVGQTVPWTWATSDILSWNITYEAA